MKGEEVTQNKEAVYENKEEVTQNKEGVTENKEEITQNKEGVTENKEEVTQREGNRKARGGNYITNVLKLNWASLTV